MTFPFLGCPNVVSSIIVITFPTLVAKIPVIAVSKFIPITILATNAAIDTGPLIGIDNKGLPSTYP